MRTAWIPEAPNHPGLYANESGTDFDVYAGKIRTAGLQPSTLNPNKAKQFPTKDACQRWCDANPTPAFRPTEHGFDE